MAALDDGSRALSQLSTLRLIQSPRNASGKKHKSLPRLSRDVQGLVLAALFPATEDVFSALTAFVSEHSREQRRCASDYLLRVALRTRLGVAADPLLGRVWLWCQRAQREMLTLAEVTCGFGLSLAVCVALGAPQPLPVETVLRAVAGRSMKGSMPALAEALLPKARVLAQVSFALVTCDMSSLLRVEWVIASL
jgi:hypothetical protein